MFRIGERVQSARPSRRRAKNKPSAVNSAPPSAFDVESLTKELQRLSVDARPPQFRPCRRATRTRNEGTWISNQATSTPRGVSEEDAEWRLNVQFAIGKTGQKYQKRRHHKAPNHVVAGNSTAPHGSRESTLPSQPDPQYRSSIDLAGPSQPSALEAELLKWCVHRCEQLKETGNQALQLGSYCRAREIYTEAINLLPAKASQTKQLLSKLLSNRAATYLFQSDLKGAINDCQAARDVYRKNIRAYTRAATCYTTLGDFEKSQSLLSRALEMLSASDPQFNALRDQMRFNEKLKGAVEHVERRCEDGDVDEEVLTKVEFFTEHVHQCERIWRLAALTYLQAHLFEKLNGTLEEAQELFNAQEGEEANQHCWWQWMRFEGVWWNPDLPIDAVLSELQNLVEQMKSRSLSEMQTTSKTENLKVEVMEKLKKSLLDANGMKDQGNKAITQKNYPRAHELYSKAISICERSGSPVSFLAVLYCNRGAASHGAGRYMEAMGDVCTALSLNPCYVKAYQRLARMHLETHNPVAAKEILKRCDSKSLPMSVQESDSQRALKESLRSAERTNHPINAYKLLGLSQTCQISDIKKTFKRLALKLHPDKASHAVKLTLSWMTEAPEFVRALQKRIRDALRDSMQHFFKDLNGAHSVLMDATERRKLDRNLREAETQSQFRNFYTSSRDRPFYNDPSYSSWWF